MELFFCLIEKINFAFENKKFYLLQDLYDYKKAVNSNEKAKSFYKIPKNTLHLPQKYI